MMDIFSPPLVTNEITQTYCNVLPKSPRPTSWPRPLVEKSLWEEWTLQRAVCGDPKEESLLLLRQNSGFLESPS